MEKETGQETQRKMEKNLKKSKYIRKWNSSYLKLCARLSLH
jgi:hypothetical protein